MASRLALTPGAAHARRRPAAEQRRAAARQRLAVQAGTRTFELGGGVVAVAPTRRRPKGVVHFLGGAFVAAVPHLTYPLLLERLADGGYTCIATPYPVTFQHVECAHAVHAAFEGALAQLRGGGGSGGGGGGALASWAAPRDAPVHGVGHSNGALLHLLVGSVCLPAAPAAAGANGSASINGSAADGSTGGDQGRPGRASNILISYNNLQVAEAVPVPLGVLQPAVQQLRGRGRLAATARQGLAQAAGAVGQLLALAESAAGGASPWQQQLQRQRQLLGSLQQWDPALIQLGSVFDEVGDGFQDFRPSPIEARQLIASRYSVPSTLLIQFSDDSTDESPEAEAFLASGRRAVRRLVLPGTHVTPCGDQLGPRIPPGGRFGPADALAMAAAAALQADTHRLADRVLEHLDSQS